jgi:DNA-binding response OmpR family regulator
MVACPWCAIPVERGRCAGCERTLDPEWRVCPWCRTPAATPPGGDDPPAEDTPRVLVVDDDPGVRAMLAAALADSFDVDTAGTAEEALAAISGTGYDGLVLDQVLPDLGGLEVIRLLRGDPATATLPVLLFTGHAALDGEAAARGAGADDYLAKPFEPRLMEERVAELCRRSPRRRAAVRT